MASFWQHTCGHTSTRDPWGRGETSIHTVCDDCRTARIGETIQFARYGTAPASGKSQNHRDQVAEIGLSVYEIVQGAIQLVGWHFGITDRALYLGTGSIVGWGSDGEPVVAVITLKKATKKQAAALCSGSQV
jgi:hypothetical protein